jgi:hypothetical protein
MDHEQMGQEPQPDVQEEVPSIHRTAAQIIQRYRQIQKRRLLQRSLTFHVKFLD